jgi:hypothetical protein
MSVASAWLLPADAKGRREILRNAYFFCVQYTQICRNKRYIFFEDSFEVLFHYDYHGIAFSPTSMFFNDSRVSIVPGIKFVNGAVDSAVVLYRPGAYP